VLDRSEILKKLKEDLGRERFDHSLRVEKTAIALARKFGVSIKKASIAALLHDCARKFDRAGLLRVARRLKLKIDPVSRLEPKLLHAELSTRFAKKDFKIRSPEILSAIRKHTIGSERMTKLEKIIFLADHVEEGRNYAGVKKIRQIAFRDLDRAIIESTSKMLKYLEDKKLPVHPGTIKTRNYYLMKK
jgi:predicted HD superfamily hydrolase involved in NAD metabolism